MIVQKKKSENICANEFVSKHNEEQYTELIGAVGRKVFRNSMPALQAFHRKHHLGAITTFSPASCLCGDTASDA
jgi:hypothetical protein